VCVCSVALAEKEKKALEATAHAKDVAIMVDTSKCPGLVRRFGIKVGFLLSLYVLALWNCVLS
jgi:hypothetical protein